jgi:amidophosphoribosyltransferase
MCGIFGIFGTPDAAALTHLGLYALQHRGQESAGIVTVDREGAAHPIRAMGLVSEAIPASALGPLIGDVAIGHTRYSTAGSNHGPLQGRRHCTGTQRQPHQRL